MSKSHLPKWWQRVQSLQYQLYRLREEALRHNDRDTAEVCKQLLLEAERLVRQRADAWIVDAERVLREQTEAGE